jgi:hypothetical protein
MDTKDLANDLLEAQELHEMAVGELISTGVATAILGPLAASVLGVIYKTTNIQKVLDVFKKKDLEGLEPIDRVKAKLSKQIEHDATFYKTALTKIAKSNSLKVLNSVALDISKHLKLSKEEFVALHDYLFEQRNKLSNITQITNS